MTRYLTKLAVPALIALAVPTLAGATPPPTFASDPDQGPPGTVITVSGALCHQQIEHRGWALPLGGGLPAGTTVHVELVGPQPGATVVAQANFTPDGSGNWAGTLTVPAGAKPGTYLVTANCDPDGIGGEQPFNYVPNPFQVTARAKRADPVEAVVTFTG